MDVEALPAAPPANAHFKISERAWMALNTANARDFYATWLALVCEAVGNVAAGVVLMRSAGAYRPSVIWPQESLDVSYLRGAIERALNDRTAVVARDTRAAGPSSAGVSRVHIVHPIAHGDEMIGAVALDVMSGEESQWQAALQHMRWGLAWPLNFLSRHQAPQEADRDAAVDLALDAQEALTQNDRFDVSALLLANALAARLGCQRFSIGLVERRGIALKSMSHAAGFDRKSDLAVDVCGLMEEAYDQRASVSHPAIALTERRISVAHADFAARWGTAAVASVLIKSAGRRVGVLTLEWPNIEKLDAPTLQTCQFVADHIGPLLELKHKQQQIFAGRLARWSKETTAKLLGPGHPSVKLGAALAALALLILIAWPAEFRVAAKAVLEGSVQRAAVAPFEGFIAEAPLRAGDIVHAGQSLAKLDDRDLQLEKLKWETERQKLVHKQREAFAKHDRPSILVTSAQIEQAQSQLKLTLEKLQRAQIASPIDGVIVTGDLSQMLGAPVTQGKVLFEIAPLNSYRVLLQVDERDVGYLRVGQQGTLLLTGAPAAGLKLTVTKLTAVATAEDARNFFRVEASLGEGGATLRPGMEGLAKIDAGRRSLLWIWTRPLIERLRMLIWAWTP